MKFRTAQKFDNELFEKTPLTYEQVGREFIGKMIQDIPFEYLEKLFNLEVNVGTVQSAENAAREGNREKVPYLLSLAEKNLSSVTGEIEIPQLTLTDKEIKSEANKYSDISGTICADEYWIISKHDGFIDGANFVLNKIYNR